MNRKKVPMKRTAALLLALALLLACAPAAMAETFSAIVTADSMDVYSDRALTQQMSSLKRYTVVQVTSYSDGVAGITFHGVKGYAASVCMERVSDYGQRAVAVASSRIYSSPSRNSQSVTVQKGTRLYVLATANGWSMVEQGGNVGYMESDRLVSADENWQAEEDTEEDEDIVYQAASMNASAKGVSGYSTATVSVYATASTRGKKLGTLQKNTNVTVLAWNKTWGYIQLNGKKGYCQIKYLKKGTAPVSKPAVKAQGTVVVSKLPVYRSASTKSAKLGHVYRGAVVNVISWSGSWAYIERNGIYGYAALVGLRRVALPAPTPTPTPSAAPTPVPDLTNAIRATVKDGSAAVFESASAGSAILGTLPEGTVVNLLAAQGEWAYIEFNGKYGYCKLSALSQDESSGIPTSGYTKADFDATVVVSGAKAYAKPNTASDSVSLTLGATVKVAAYSSEWACIVHGSDYAFVPISNLSRASYDPVTGNGTALQTLMKALLAYGYYDGIPSATYNAAAGDAIKRFQSACGLSQTGVADQTLQRILYSGYAPQSSLLSATLSSGAKNDNVKRMQTRLYALGYFSKTASVDGDYGAKTAAAVTLFQNANGLNGTGTADPATLKALYSVSAAHLPAGVTAADVAASIPTPTTTSTYMTYMPGNTASKVTSYSPTMSNANKLEYVIYVASTKLGCPYVYGAIGPAKFDCSGLTYYSFKQIEITLLRTAYQQGYDNSRVKVEGVANLRRGDTVFFNTVSDSDLCDHVGIYLGGGYFIHASSGGHKVVVSQLASGYYNRVFSWGRRILN